MALTIERAQPTGLSAAERGKDADGNPISLDRRLYVQLQAFTGCENTSTLAHALRETSLEGVLYEDVNDPRGVALLTFSEDPEYFVTQVRPFVNAGPFRALAFRPDFALFGRTYSIGYEQDLEETLVGRPRRTILNPDWNWAVWYPLRRSGEFEQLSAEEQRTMLMEHGGIGRAYGRSDLAHDVRLACHGLDVNDNDFIAGLVGSKLHGLSAVVQHMRKTKQTSLYLERLGPFFVGRAVWKSALEG